MTEILEKYRYPILLITMINFLIIPIWISTNILSASLIVVISYSLIIISGINVTTRRVERFWVIIVGLATLFCIWIEFAMQGSTTMAILRILSSFVLFVLLLYVLILNILNTEEICIEMIVAVMSGFILLGIIGGVVFEFLDLNAPGSLKVSTDTGNFTYYYFSIVNLTSVGLGDIHPQTALAQSITILLGITGQFYLAFGVTVFVGKFLNHQQDKPQQLL